MFIKLIYSMKLQSNEIITNQFIITLLRNSGSIRISIDSQTIREILQWTNIKQRIPYCKCKSFLHKSKITRHFLEKEKPCKRKSYASEEHMPLSLNANSEALSETYLLPWKDISNDIQSRSSMANYNGNPKKKKGKNR